MASSAETWWRWLGRLPDVRVLEFDQEHAPDELGALLAQADIVYHLAGVNRPQTEAEFITGNVDLTTQLCDRLLALGKATPVVLSSSIQAELDNPYGDQQAPGRGGGGALRRGQRRPLHDLPPAERLRQMVPP